MRCSSSPTACSTRTDPVQALRLDAPVVEHPANAVRSVARCFASEIDDKPWLHDEDFWRRYLSMVVAQRFNRVNLMVGLGYNFPWHVTDAYLFFAYPFLVDVPGSDVRVPQLPDDERERNLEMLRFISDDGRRPRTGVPVRAVDARVRVVRQPARRGIRSRG